MTPSALNSPRGYAIGVATHVAWGFFPLYFSLLHPAGAFEVIVHRAVWGLAFCLVVLTVTRRFYQVKDLLRERRTVALLAVAGFFVLNNWTIYVWAVMNDHTVDAALGYFINPLLTVFLAGTVLKERLTKPQTVAVLFGVAAIVVMVIGLGRIPWVAIGLPATFAFYGLIKKRVSTTAPVVAGMAIETAAVTPLLLGYFAWLAWGGNTSLQLLAREGSSGFEISGHFMLLVGSGILTVVVLMMFASAARLLNLAVLGLLQYIAPIMQLLIGVLIFHEHMEPARWIGTGLIWIGLVVLTWDSLRRHPA
ncbi:MAG: EamA family transporter RarD [Actinomycetaceae bacterium]|nr:EamA family transporter RarD [Actinomycetaceae bacterium]